ncbi:MAG: diguanylate cyclase, partial [Acholeplasmataceae bacterium]|nr:diguanylate cyclase [Acholeplasmataceae bacterium]
VTEQKQREEDIIYTSNHDFLTRLPNRKYFEERLIELDQQQFLPLLVAMIDFDGLKLINDAYGHNIGDEALKKVSEILRNNLRNNDFLARVGGDEFIIVCPNTISDEFNDLQSSILKNLQFTCVDEIKVSLSMGHDVKKCSSTDINEVIKNAENNMYSNKILHGQSARNETIMTLFETLNEKFEEEKLHSDRVSQYCKKMGEKLKLSIDQTKELAFAGLMHDIGKITIPDNILDKPGKLTDEEWIIMKKHTINGYNILRSADKYSRLAEYALTHHERWDGNGYPNGLKGEDIPLFSRIISITDAYEAMTADRPYRKALDSKVAVEELYRCAGSQFDQALVDIFVKEVVQIENREVHQ